MLMSASLATPPPPRAAPQVQVHGEQIEIVGSINRAVSERFSEIMRSPSGRQVRSLRVDSTGGDARAAMEIASLVRDRRLPVLVGRICGSACAAYILPAAAHARFEPGAMINLHHMPSPLMVQIGLAAMRRGEIVPELTPERYEQGMTSLIADQREFYGTIGVDPRPMEGIMEVWVELHERLRALNKPVDADRISFVPDLSYLRNCLGLRNVEWRDFDRADSIVYARRGLQPQAFLIAGHLYFEGERISDRDFSCRP